MKQGLPFVPLALSCLCSCTSSLPMTEPKPPERGFSLSGISPPKGPTTGGFKLQISGSNFVFGQKPHVTLGSVPAADVLVQSTSSIEVTVPAQPGGRGKVDVVLASADGKSAKLDRGFEYYDGDLHLSSETIHPIGDRSESVVALDLNGDGTLDVVTAEKDASKISVFYGKGDGTFQKPPFAVATGLSPASLITADLNGDGLVDLVSANTDSDSLTILYNTGLGGDNALAKAIHIPTGKNPFALLATDVNGDGRVDLVCSSLTQGSVQVYLRGNDGRYDNPKEVRGLSLPYSLSAGLISEEARRSGRPEIVVQNAGTSLVLLRNLGGGNLKVEKETALPATHIALVDLDGDGRPEVLASGLTEPGREGELAYGRFRPDGAIFSLSYVPVWQGIAGSFATGDFDGDGRIDVALSGALPKEPSAQGIALVMGQEGGEFLAPAGLRYPWSTLIGPGRSVLMADVTGDARLDVVGARADAQGGFSLLINDSR